MVEPFINTPVMPDIATSPLAGHIGQDTVQTTNGQIGVTITEHRGVAIADVAAWPGAESNTVNAIKKTTGLKLSKSIDAANESAQAFQHAPGRWTVISSALDLSATLTQAVGNNATVVDLSHGRTLLTVTGSQSRWVLAKLFAIDFSETAFALHKGISTQHHEIFAQIQRVTDDGFAVLIFRSYARSFTHSLIRAARETGYRII